MTRDEAIHFLRALAHGSYEPLGVIESTLQAMAVLLLERDDRLIAAARAVVEAEANGSEATRCEYGMAEPLAALRAALEMDR